MESEIQDFKKEETKKDKSMDLKCPECSGVLKYRSEVAAPGYGQNWECSKCKNSFLKTGPHITNWKNVDPRIFEDANMYI